MTGSVNVGRRKKIIKKTGEEDCDSPRHHHNDGLSDDYQSGDDTDHDTDSDKNEDAGQAEETRNSHQSHPIATSNRVNDQEDEQLFTRLENRGNHYNRCESNCVQDGVADRITTVTVPTQQAVEYRREVLAERYLKENMKAYCQSATFLNYKVLISKAINKHDHPFVKGFLELYYPGSEMPAPLGTIVSIGRDCITKKRGHIIGKLKRIWLG